MKIGLYGKKVGMTQVFSSFGFCSDKAKQTALPVTLVKVELCQVSQVKVIAAEGYNAVQIAYGYDRLNKRSKPVEGYFKKMAQLGLEPRKFSLISSLLRCSFQKFGEFRVSNPEKYKPGQIIGLEHLLFELSLNKNQKVQVTGQSIGKGFAGNQKRHHFKRGPMTHGSKNHRAPGSIGAGSTPGRVYPGKKMSGQLGNKKVTMKNVEILYANSERNILVLHGSLPGKRNSLVKIQAIPNIKL